MNESKDVDSSAAKRGARGWAWGRRTLARVGELRALLDCAAVRAGTSPEVQNLQRCAAAHLDEAEHAIGTARRGLPLHADEVDSALANMNAAHTLVIQLAPLHDVPGMLPDLAALVDENLPANDRRRSTTEKVLSRATQGEVSEADRRAVVDAVRAAYRVQEREVVAVRSFSRIVYFWSAGLMLISIAIAVLAWFHDNAVPLCFDPQNKVVCPTVEAPASGVMEFAYRPATTPLDYVVVEGAGFVAAAVTAAATLREIKGTATAYNVPLSLAVLKLPTGALTAVLGLLLMRGEFVPGLTALDSSAQVTGWAVIFGAAQQLFTRFVDERGAAVMKSVTGPENPKPGARPGRSSAPGGQQIDL